jgi:type IV pilus assembly protein PilB
VPTQSTARPRERLEDLLVIRQIAPPRRIEEWRQSARERGIAFEEAVFQSGALSRAQVLQVLENHYFCPSVDLSEAKIPLDVLMRVPRELALHHEAVPVQLDKERLVVALTDPTDARALEALAVAAHGKILPRVALRSDVLAAIAAHYPSGQDGRGTERAAASAAEHRPSRSIPLLSLDDKSPVDAVTMIFRAAVEGRATDVHFHPAERDLAVRFRIDGILKTVARIPEAKKAATIARLKVASNLDIAEHRLPQDGRQTLQHDGQPVDLRISTLPSQFGENVVVRLLRKDTSLLDLEKLRMPPAIRQAQQDMIDNPNGFFLVTGPTGSGKTTTLYATLNALDREETNITTLEDPIEYSLAGITQVQINESAGLTFASGLRSILRQDPDVVLVGEIRDIETVEIACRAALTGHKVLSTLHTNDACQAITRLLDMGLAPHLLTATLRGVVAQRLVRVICEQCRTQHPPTDSELAVLGYPKGVILQRGAGCEHCAHTGFQGRMAIFEYFKVDESLHRLILDRASPYAIRHAAQRNGMVLMADFAKKAVLEGLTTVGEVQRVVFSAEDSEQLCGGCGRVVSQDFAVCPFCQQNLKERCASCGSAVERDWEACPNCGKELEREWQRVFCRGCLAPVDPRWATCNYCGEEIR